jgi:hypothetical protein
MGFFKKQINVADKQLWAVGLLGHHLKSRNAETIDAIGAAIGAGIAFASPPSIAVSSGETWERAHGSQMVVKGLSAEDKAKALADYNSTQHLSAKKQLLDVLLERSEAAIYLVVPVYARTLVTPDLPEDYDWMTLNPATRELAHLASDCLRDSAGSYLDQKGKCGSTEYQFTLDALCYAGAVLRT